ncbi:MAG: lytic murein transglycosylase [Hyphomicrobiales bacterium]|nr:lytic murein transglycosylase [Hyphomicrobiales bacterium]
MRATRTALTAALFFVLSISTAEAACKTSGSFNGWLKQFKADAAAQGVSRRTINAALNGVTYDKRVIGYDRRQTVFSQSFLKFSGRMVNKSRLSRGRAKMKKHASTFKRIEQKYGVPAPVITAFWGLETDFGAVQGNFSTIRSLATLAYDCRRPELFRPQLVDALRIVERGDLRLEDMVGAWAGELGQTQFLPSDYMETAVDFDGDGRRDLKNSAADALASGAALMRSFGWQRGQPWLQEVRLTRSLPWAEADLAISHPRSQWAKWGVTRANGKGLRKDRLPAALLLPMGRNGPAFLAYDNFRRVYLKWNESLLYSTTAAYFATRLAGAAPAHRGSAQGTALELAEIKQLQSALQRRGFDVGKIDGIIGAGTRKATKAMQIKFGLPADSWPTRELLRQLR